MARDLSGKRVAILATDGVERIELEQPRGALYGAGADTELLSIHPGEIQARQFDLVSAGRQAHRGDLPRPVDAYHCGRRQGPPAYLVAQLAR